MAKPLIVIISGHPCTGKTSLARVLARGLPLPLIAKDDIKEVLFDTLGAGDRAWSQKLGRATYTLMYQALETQLRAGRPAIIESNFDAAIAGAEFARLAEHFPFEPFQIMCHTEREVLFERFRRRSLSGERHPGHLDQILYAELAARYDPHEYRPLDIGGTIIMVDTTDFARLDYGALVARIGAAFAPRT